MQCKIHNPATITDRISWTEEIGNLSPPPPPMKDRKILRSFIFEFFLGGGGFGGAVGLLFHFILSKIVVKITVGWVVRGKICIGQWALSQKQDDKNT